MPGLQGYPSDFRVKRKSELKKEENVGYMKQQMKLTLTVGANNCSLWHIRSYIRGGRESKGRRKVKVCEGLSCG